MRLFFERSYYRTMEIYHMIQTKVLFFFAQLFKLQNNWFYEALTIATSTAIIVYFVLLWKKFAQSNNKFALYPTVIFTVIMSLGLLVHVGLITYLALSEEQTLKNYAFDFEQLHEEYANIEVYDKDEKKVYSVIQNGVNRENVSINEMPSYLKDAFVSVEDKTFYTHSGISVRGYLRAFYYKALRPNDKMHGGSTLTQQLVKTINEDIYNRTILHKYQEALLAVVIENKYKKEEILEMYLNRIFLGKGDIYGVGAASKIYFDKKVSELSLAESAFLAGLAQAPSAYTEDLTLGNQRKNTVLDVMKENGFITESQWKKAREEVISFKEGTKTSMKQTYMDAYVDYVLKEAVDMYGLSEKQLKQNGYQIYTYLDPKLQAFMDETVKNYSFQDGNAVQVAMAAVDNDHRNIIALYGGKDYIRGYQNRSYARYQPGSILKPLVVYAPALDSGKWDAFSEVKDEKKDFGGYIPKNAGEKYEGNITLERALIRSANVPAVSVFQDIGVDKGIDVLENLQIPVEEKDKQLHLALGGMEKGVTAIEMAQAYSVFPNYGYFEPAYSIKYIKDENGEFVKPKKEKENQGKDIYTTKTAYYMTEMLQKVVTSESGTGQKAQIGRPLAGKTGTAEEAGTTGNRDAWFVGYTPEITMSVHVGFDKPSKEHYLTTSGGGDPAKLFSDIVGKQLEGTTKKAFKVPEGVQPLAQSVNLEKVNDVNASLIKEQKRIEIRWEQTKNTSGVVYKVFKKGKDGGDILIGKTKDNVLYDEDVSFKEPYLPTREKPNLIQDFEGWADDWKIHWKENLEILAKNILIFLKNCTFKLERYYVVAEIDGETSQPSNKTWTFVPKVQP